MPRVPRLRRQPAPADPADVSTTTSWRGETRPQTSTTRLHSTAAVDDRTSDVTLAPALDHDRSRQAIRIRLPRRPRAMERRAVFVAGALLLGVFASGAVARSISDVFVSRGEVAIARAANDALRAELDASRDETTFASDPTYLRFAARGLGYGRGKEQPFALRQDAAPAPSIVPLGSGLDPTPNDDVIGGIVDLLVGS